jgi:mannose-6-phosphate isomerase
VAALSLTPLRFEPLFKRLLWGGRRLGTLLGKPIGPEADYAESWELADHGADVSRVAEGPLAGRSLRDLIAADPAGLLGPALADRREFPLLVKFLDANGVLSVQVHPDDARGRRLANDNGKTETWVILHADPGAVLYAGLRPGVTREAFAAAMASGTVEPLLHRFEPRAGDCVLIPAGTVHAIGAGIVLAEFQQMSDATFRVHDWGRLGPDGQPRTLHPEQSLACIDFAAGPVAPVVPEVEPAPWGRRERLSRCPYFALERLVLAGGDAAAPAGRADRFTILQGLGGTAELEHDGARWTVRPGDTWLLPAALGAVALRAGDAATVLTCVVP